MNRQSLKQGVITAGLTANFRATGEIDSKAAATSGEYSDGTAALAGSVQISNSDIQTTVGGNITANLRGKQAPAAGVVRSRPTGLSASPDRNR